VNLNGPFPACADGLTVAIVGSLDVALITVSSPAEGSVAVNFFCAGGPGSDRVGGSTIIDPVVTDPKIIC
jgi:hypothetical protein